MTIRPDERVEEEGCEMNNIMNDINMQAGSKF